MTEIAVHTPLGPATLGLFRPDRMARSLWSHRDLIWQFSLREVRQRNAGTQLGIVWAGLQPLMMLLVYTFVFSTTLNIRLSNNTQETAADYAVMLFAGLMVFQLFVDPLGRSPALIINRKAFVKRHVFPVEVLPLTLVISTALYSGIGLLLVVVANLVMTGGFSPTIYLLPVVLLPAILMAIGLGWILSAIGVFVPDLQNVTGSVVQRLLFFMTPIFYSVDRVNENYRWLLYLNPMTPVVEGARDVMILGNQPDWALLGVWIAISLVVCQVGYAMFMRAKGGFADVL
ncbi:MAG: ABC transporter permease [Phycisphaerales bacterium JB037]